MNSEPLIFKKRSNIKPKVISVRLDDEVLKRIDEAVIESGRSRNELINAMLRYAVDNVIVEP